MTLTKESKYLLLLGANQFQRERAVIGAARAYRGPIMATDTAGVYSKNKLFTEVIECWDADPQQCLRAVLSYEERTGMSPEAVIPINDFVLNSSYLIAKHYGLPSLDTSTIQNCRSKFRAKKIFIENNLPCVRSHVFSTIAEGKNIANDIGYPVVIKPYNLGGSCGVLKIEDGSNFEQSYHLMKKGVETYAMKYDSEAEKFIIEKYIESDAEVSVEILCDRENPKVLAVTDKFLGAEPHFAEIGHCMPSKHTNNSAITSMAAAACKALDIQFGLAHVEMKITKCGPLLIEVGCRPAGDGIMDLLERAYGFNPYELHIRSYMASLTDIKINTTPNLKIGIGYLHPESGVVTSIKDRLPAEILQNVVRVVNTTKIGDYVDVPKDFSTRQGYVEFVWPISHHLVSIEDDYYVPENCVTDLYEIFRSKGYPAKQSQFLTRNGHEAWITDGANFAKLIKDIILQ